MTIKEEIKEILIYFDVNVSDDRDEDLKLAINRALTAVEKLIDENIQEYPNTILKGMGIIESNRDRYTPLEHVDIVVEVLKELKEELGK